MNSPSRHRILTNAGRCDLCGRTVNMANEDDTLTHIEFGPQEAGETHITGQQAADAVADAIEQAAESGADRELARIIREKQSVRAHGECLNDSAYSQLPTEEDYDDE